MGKNEEKLKGSEKFAAPPHLSDSSPLKPAGIGAAACKNHVGVESARFASRSGRRKGADLLRPCRVQRAPASTDAAGAELRNFLPGLTDSTYVATKFACAVCKLN